MLVAPHHAAHKQAPIAFVPATARPARRVGAAQSAHELERLWDTRANSSFLGAQGAPGPMASYALTGRTGSLMYMAPGARAQWLLRGLCAALQPRARGLHAHVLLRRLPDPLRLLGHRMSSLLVTPRGVQRGALLRKGAGTQQAVVLPTGVLLLWAGSCLLLLPALTLLLLCCRWCHAQCDVFSFGIMMHEVVHK